MTNQQKFIETFGQEVFNTLRDNCDNIYILKWFTKEYEGSVTHVATIPLNAPIASSENDITIKEEPKKRSGGKPGRKTYNPVWYEETVEDFYLGSARTKDIALDDDPTAKKTKSLDGLKYRFEEAIKKVGVEDCVVVHKYYAGTVNECLVLENIRNQNHSRAVISCLDI